MTTMTTMMTIAIVTVNEGCTIPKKNRHDYDYDKV